MKSLQSQVNLYIGNHGKIDGIEDYIDILKHILQRDGIKLSISKTLDPDLVNIVIDEFTNYHQNQKIEQFKTDYPDTPLIFIITEFVERKHGVQSFNHFGNLIDSALIALSNLIIKSKRSDFPSVGLRDWLIMIPHAPTLLGYSLVNGLTLLAARIVNISSVRGYFNKHRARSHRLGYLQMRYIGLAKFIKYADMIITSHEEILPGLIQTGWLKKNDDKFAGVVYPEFDEKTVLNKFSTKKQLSMEITGSVSPYRKYWFHKCNKNILIYGLNNTIGLVQARGFGTRKVSASQRSAFSLHPPQTKNWPYSSPTRLFRVLQVDGNIPIITHYFGQNPIEDICIRYEAPDTLTKMCELYDAPEGMQSYVKPRIHAYNEIVKERNQGLTASIKKLAADFQKPKRNVSQ